MCSSLEGTGESSCLGAWELRAGQRKQRGETAKQQAAGRGTGRSRATNEGGRTPHASVMAPSQPQMDSERGRPGMDR